MLYYNLFVFLVVFCTTKLVRPDSSAVYILNEHLQLVTSSSLRWVSTQNGDRPLHAVKGGTNGSESLFVCRTQDGGYDQSSAGQLSWSGCTVVAGSTIKLLTSYQVLVNIDGSARMEWQDWQQFTSLPPGAVNVATDIYVAREMPTKTTQNFLGGLYLQEQYGLVILPPGGRRLTTGQLLVEHEPVRYELTSFKPGRLRSVQSTDVTLEQPIVVANEHNMSFTEGILVNYTHQDLMYFGKGHNIPTGSLVTLHYSNGTRIKFEWGLPKLQPVLTKMRLGAGQHTVPPKARSTVHVIATRVDRRWDYFATLSAHYRDGAILMRPVKGVFRQVNMHHLRPVYSVPVFTDRTSTESPPALKTTTTRTVMTTRMLENIESWSHREHDNTMFNPLPAAAKATRTFFMPLTLVLTAAAQLLLP